MIIGRVSLPLLWEERKLGGAAMNLLSILGLTIGGLIVLFPLAFVTYINVGGVRQILGRSANPGKIRSSIQTSSTQGCAIDADCPRGYVCMNGSCVPQNS